MQSSSDASKYADVEKIKHIEQNAETEPIIRNCCHSVHGLSK